MVTEEKFNIHLSNGEFEIIYSSFNEVCNGFNLQDFEIKIGMTENSACEYMEKLKPVVNFMRHIKYKHTELPKNYRLLQEYSAYWSEESGTIMFKSQKDEYIFYQPEEGKCYFNRITEMEFFLDTEIEEQVSIILRISVFDMKLMLAMVRETYEYLYKEIGGDVYAIRIGRDPIEAEKMMEKMQKEIAKHTA